MFVFLYSPLSINNYKWMSESQLVAGAWNPCSWSSCRSCNESLVFYSWKALKKAATLVSPFRGSVAAKNAFEGFFSGFDLRMTRTPRRSWNELMRRNQAMCHLLQLSRLLLHTRCGPTAEMPPSHGGYMSKWKHVFRGAAFYISVWNNLNKISLPLCIDEYLFQIYS